LGGYNSLLAGLTMEIDHHFGDTLKLLEDAKETCLSTIHPNESCHEKMQNTLQHTQQLYDKMLGEYKNRYATIATRPPPRPPM
jgi:UDP-N-acetylglucosamine 2-epimerase